MGIHAAIDGKPIVWGVLNINSIIFVVNLFQLMDLGMGTPNK